MDGARFRWLSIAARTMREPMIVLLLLACGIYLALGELREGLLLAFMVCMTLGLTLQQQWKSDRALQALRELSSPQVLVWRDGRAVRIDSRALQVGDQLMVAEGERIAADAVLLRSQNLRVDEALLTGESAPVAKAVAVAVADLPPAAPGGDGLPYLWSGTLVVEGEGLARVTAIGRDTELGKVGRSLAELEPGDTPLQRGIAGTVRLLAALAIATSVLVTLLYGLARGEWLAALLAGIAVSMALLPEELPVIMTIFPVIGAWRLARSQVLTRRLAALEALGCISVLCVDKTGTLTCNRMQVAELHADGVALRLDGRQGELPAPFARLARCASLASKRRAYDPMEIAFHLLAGGAPEAEPLREYPLSPAVRAMSQVWPAAPAAAGMMVAAKGAPEAIAVLCRLDAGQRLHMTEAMDAMAARGLRVLAVAQASYVGGALPATQDGFAFQYLGLLGLSDPLRGEVASAVQACASAGVRVLMITGDYPATARSIAAQAGIAADAVLSGDELEQLDAAALRRRLAVTSICARIRPTQKLRIVQALQADGAVVGMTGDGVNDAPALKAADVGIAMGGRGSEVAREAAALVLLDDNFASIVNGIRLGRRIFANMRHAMSYVLAMHVPIAGMALLPVLLDWPVLLQPVHIALLELIIDPACALAFENQAAAPGQMQRPPRRADEALLDRRTVLTALVQGVLVLLVVACAYGWALGVLAEPAARAVGYAVLVLANVGLIFSNLSYRRSLVTAVRTANRAFWLVAAAALALLALVLCVPQVAAAFQIAPLSWPQLLAVAGIGLASMALSELVRRLAK